MVFGAFITGGSGVLMTRYFDVQGVIREYEKTQHSSRPLYVQLREINLKIVETFLSILTSVIRDLSLAKRDMIQCWNNFSKSLHRTKNHTN